MVVSEGTTNAEVKGIWQQEGWDAEQDSWLVSGACLYPNPLSHVC
jgi:hypothetical protein